MSNKILPTLFLACAIPIASYANVIYSNEDLKSGCRADVSGKIDLDSVALANEFSGYMNGVAASLAANYEICLPPKKTIGYYISHDSYNELKSLKPDSQEAYFMR